MLFVIRENLALVKTPFHGIFTSKGSCIFILRNEAVTVGLGVHTCGAPVIVGNPGLFSHTKTYCAG